MTFLDYRDWEAPGDASPDRGRSFHGDGNPSQGGRQFHANLWTAELQDDAVGILQLHAAGSGRKSAAGAGSAIVPGNVSGTPQVHGPADQLGGRCANGEADAGSRNRERIVSAAECQHTLATSDANDEPAFGEHDADRPALRPCRGRNGRQSQQSKQSYHNRSPSMHHHYSLLEGLSPDHRGPDLTLATFLLSKDHREVAEYGEQDARYGVADRESDPGHRALDFSRRLARRA